MTSEDRPAFAAALYMLGEVHRTDVSSDLAEVYFDALTDYALSEVLNAIRRNVKVSKWFPKPIEISDMIQSQQGREYQRIVRAWNIRKREALEAAAGEAICDNAHVWTDEPPS